MKNKLLALAVLSSIAGAASAQSNVTFYGIVDLGIDYDNGKSRDATTGSTSKWTMASGQTSGSRFGFKGSEDLGGGLAAIFTLENGFNADDGSQGYGGRIFGRQSWVGLSGGFGAVKFGRQYSTTYLALSAIDPFSINTAGDAQRVYGYGLGKSDPISRSDNTVTYLTPDFSGFTAQAGYGFGEQAGAFNKSSTKFVGVNYVNGPLTALATYQNTNGVAFAPANAGTGAAATPTSALDAIVIPSGLGTSTTTSATVENSFIGATYDFGIAKMHAGFGNTKAQAVGDLKVRNYLVGATVPLGAGNVLTSWNRTNVTDVVGGVSNQYAVGYVYPLSKRTTLYTIGALTKNGSGVRMNAWANGQNDREFQFGMRHMF